MFRRKYARQSRATIESTVAKEIRVRVSGELFNLGKSTRAKTVEKVEASKVRQVTKQLRKMKRWHRIASIVGWVGILLSDWMLSHWVNEANDEVFERFVGFYATQRPTILEMLHKYWNDAPALLRMSGSKHTKTEPLLMDLRYSRTRRPFSLRGWLQPCQSRPWAGARRGCDVAMMALEGLVMQFGLRATHVHAGISVVTRASDAPRRTRPGCVV